MDSDIICPVNDFSCPYCTTFGYCHMFEEEGVEPYNECDAFAYLERDEEEEE